jgi:hypothetical protein
MPSDQERVALLFETMLHRAPTATEADHWIGILRASGDFFQLFVAMANKAEYQALHRVRSSWTPGHFYSPIVDPATVQVYVAESRKITPEEVAGITLDVSAMEDFWCTHQNFIAKTPFTKAPKDSLRYYWRDSPYPIGDAVTYRAVIGALRPKAIIEIGSGFSTACALDTLDEIGHTNVEFTCIEPHPAALLARLRESDLNRIKLVPSLVQNVNASTFGSLERNDILFVDSTHVLKTGSDVHYEFFSIIPRLKPGVMVHFHDIRWPFEYPDPFIFDRNFSWNEAYALRALLMFSSRLEVFFYNSLFAERHANLIRETFSDFAINPGSSIWLRVRDY